MSDSPAGIKDIASAAFAQHGWIVAAATTTWAVVLRALIGLHLSERKSIRTRLGKIEDLLSRQDERLKNIEARSKLRRSGDRQPPIRNLVVDDAEDEG